ncbi:MAG TPA: integrin, partial [Nitrospirae bacterium]|nr:integrin [Nitrospirota bacterium]
INGNMADNSASQAGAVYIFSRSGGTWTEQDYVKASNTEGGDHFGSSVALSSDGNTLAEGVSNEDSAATGINGNETDNSAANAGAVYIFVRNGSWSQKAYVKASNTEGGDVFGASVALSSDGNTLAVGVGLEDSAATGINGNAADNSAARAGAVYLY